MSVFSIYSKDKDVDATKEGFCWTGFLFTLCGGLIGAVWAWTVGLTGTAFFILVISLLAFVANANGNAQLSLLALAGLAGAAFLVGMKGNEWRGNAMKRDGYSLVRSGLAAPSRSAALNAGRSLAGVDNRPAPTLS